MDTPEKIQFRQTRDFGDLLNITFTFIRKNFKLLLKSYFIILGPFILLTSYFGGAYNLDSVLMQAKGGPTDTFFQNAALFFFFSIISYGILIAWAYSFIYLYHQSENGDFELADLSKLAFRRFGYIAASLFFLLLILLLATLFFIIPGVYLRVVLPMLC